MVSFLVRDTLTNTNSYPETMGILSVDYLIADVYYIIAGPKSGAIISRNRTVAADIWSLDPNNGRWFEVETNYDHWKNPPWFDNRYFFHYFA